MSTTSHTETPQPLADSARGKKIANQNYTRVVTRLSITDTDVQVLLATTALPAPSLATVAIAVGIDARFVRHSLDRLVSAGLVEWADNTDGSSIHPLVFEVPIQALSAVGSPQPAADSRRDG